MSNEIARIADGSIDVARKELTVPLDEHADLLIRRAYLKTDIKRLQEELDTLDQRVRDLLGDNWVGTLDGAPVVTLEPIKRFNESAFRKADPEMHRLYQRSVLRTELDVDLLQQARPDVYAQFQVRPLKDVK